MATKWTPLGDERGEKRSCTGFMPQKAWMELQCVLWQDGRGISPNYLAGWRWLSQLGTTTTTTTTTATFAGGKEGDTELTDFFPQGYNNHDGK